MASNLTVWSPESRLLAVVVDFVNMPPGSMVTLFIEDEKGNEWNIEETRYERLHNGGFGERINHHRFPNGRYWARLDYYGVTVRSNNSITFNYEVRGKHEPPNAAVEAVRDIGFVAISGLIPDYPHVWTVKDANGQETAWNWRVGTPDSDGDFPGTVGGFSTFVTLRPGMQVHVQVMESENYAASEWVVITLTEEHFK